MPCEFHRVHRLLQSGNGLEPIHMAYKYCHLKNNINVIILAYDKVFTPCKLLATQKVMKIRVDVGRVKNGVQERHVVL